MNNNCRRADVQVFLWLLLRITIKWTEFTQTFGKSQVTQATLTNALLTAPRASDNFARKRNSLPQLILIYVLRKVTGLGSLSKVKFICTCTIIMYNMQFDCRLTFSCPYVFANVRNMAPTTANFVCIVASSLWKRKLGGTMTDISYTES
jgi:hypothetical protein